jgi:hypothetical protein
MKRFIQTLTLALFLGLFTVLPAFAQDDTTTITTSAFNASTTMNYVIVVVLAVLLTGLLIFGSRMIPYLAKLMPPETASSLYEAGVRFGFELALNQAAQTPSLLDDEFFERMAQARGHRVTVFKDADGKPISYKVEYAGPPAVQAQAEK